MSIKFYTGLKLTSSNGLIALLSQASKYQAQNHFDLTSSMLIQLALRTSDPFKTGQLVVPNRDPDCLDDYRRIINRSLPQYLNEKLTCDWFFNEQLLLPRINQLVKPEWLNQTVDQIPTIKDYGYWDNVDRPNDITKARWDKRGQDWRKATAGWSPEANYPKAVTLTLINRQYQLTTYQDFVHNPAHADIIQKLIQDYYLQRQKTTQVNQRPNYPTFMTKMLKLITGN